MQEVTQATMEFMKQYWAPLVCGFAIVAVLPLIVGYVVLVERKIMADMQARLGPMRVGPHGLLQPIADAVKLLIKEDIIPEDADKLVFWLAPVLSVGAALLAMAGFAGRAPLPSAQRNHHGKKIKVYGLWRLERGAQRPTNHPHAGPSPRQNTPKTASKH